MQSSSRSRPFKSGLIGASPITDANVSDKWRLTTDKFEFAARHWTLVTRHFSLLSRCTQFCTPLCEGGGSWCKSTREHQLLFMIYDLRFMISPDGRRSVVQIINHKS